MKGTTTDYSYVKLDEGIDSLIPKENDYEGIKVSYYDASNLETDPYSGRVKAEVADRMEEEEQDFLCKNKWKMNSTILKKSL